MAGNWTYRLVAGGSEADFADSGGHVRLTVRCSRASRIVSLIRYGSAAAPLLAVTTSYDDTKKL